MVSESALARPQAQEGSLATKLPGALGPVCGACAEPRSLRVMECC